MFRKDQSWADPRRFSEEFTKIAVIFTTEHELRKPWPSRQLRVLRTTATCQAVSRIRKHYWQSSPGSFSVSVIDAKRAALRQSSPRRASPPRPPSRRPTTSTSGGKLENLAKQGEQTLAAVRGVKWRADGRGRAAPAPVALLYSAPASLLLHPGVVFFCSLISFLV